jgi:hypothetical protein
MQLTRLSDVDIIITIESAPPSVKNTLLTLPDSPFVQQAQYFYYQNPEGNYIQVDITPVWQVGSLLSLCSLIVNH